MREPHVILQDENEPTPITKLPDDIIREIFKHFDTEERLQPIPVPYARTIVDVRTDILNLTQICSSWRQISFGLNHLWSTIYLTDGGNDVWYQTLEEPKTTHFIDAWLKRANASRALYLFHRRDASIADSKVRAIRRLIYAHPFHKLCIYSSFFDRLHFLQEFPNQSIEKVEHLTLSWCEGGRRSSSRQQICSRSTKVPKLRSLEIHGERWDFQNAQLAIPWSQLRALSFLSPLSSLSQLFNIVRQCPLLESFGLRCSIDFVEVRDYANIHLPNLRQFDLTVESSNVAETWLRLLVIPSITTIQLSAPSPTKTSNCNTSTWVKLIERSGGMQHIRKLTACCPGSSIDVAVVIGRLPSLEYIEIDSDVTATLTDSSMEALADGKLGPALRHIKTNSIVHLDAAVNLLQSRFRNRRLPSLEYAHFQFYSPSSKMLCALFAQIQSTMESEGRNPLLCLGGSFEGGSLLQDMV